MNDRIEAGHGSGGRMTRKLIRELFLKHFNNQELNNEGDSALVEVNSGILAITTDSYVVSPLFFPGGDLGKLAVCGTVNDLSVSGAVPRWLTAGFILEEGLPLATLEGVVTSMAATAREAGVKIVAGDTKVVGKGQADSIYINTSGVGIVPENYRQLSCGELIHPGDLLLLSGSTGDHEAAIINAREGFFDKTRLVSDCAPLNGLISNMLEKCEGIKFMRDITRGGLAGILSEIAEMAGAGLEIIEADITINEPVAAFCEVLGFDPLQFASEGCIVIVLDNRKAEKVLKVLREHKYGKHAAVIGRVTKEHPAMVIMETVIGGRRIIEPPWSAKTPRIC